MARVSETGSFTPKPSRFEAKSDSTTRAAKQIIDGETALRIAKTERLRAARLAQEAAQEPLVVAPKKPRKRAVKAV